MPYSIVRTTQISGVPRNFVRGGGVQQIQLRTEGRKKGNLGAVAPLSGVPLNLQSGSTLSNFRDVEGCYGCIFHRTVNSAQLCQNFGISWGGGGVEHPKPPVGTPLHNALPPGATDPPVSHSPLIIED
jgi:hypothetical protein